MKTIDEERKEFEADLQKRVTQLKPEILLERRADGKYASLLSQYSWEAWQAARNQSNNVPVASIKQKANEFKFSELGCDLHSKINCAEISANKLMDIVYQNAYVEGWNNATQSNAEPVLYIAKSLVNKTYATSTSEAEAKLFLAQSGYKNDGVEAIVIPLYTSPQQSNALEMAAKAIDDLASSGENKDDWTITRDLAFYRAAEAVRNLITQPAEPTQPESDGK
ncbi:MAG: hypothetical protein CTY33_00145 [Methylotenera sp.]|nr:MAG: hypothetical protein CTY33_00145 [Methylotenera sp.]